MRRVTFNFMAKRGFAFLMLHCIQDNKVMYGPVNAGNGSITIDIDDREHKFCLEQHITATGGSTTIAPALIIVPSASTNSNYIYNITIVNDNIKNSLERWAIRGIKSAVRNLYKFKIEQIS